MSVQSQPFISICIPAYKRIHYLRRLLRSIAAQTFREFEVVISDDSDDDSVEKTAKEFEGLFIIRYYKNKTSLGTPANWNFAIDKANGEWIKLIHDDDWFATETALQAFADAARKGTKFIVSNYKNVDDNGSILPKTRFTTFIKTLFIKQPMVLFYKNYIGQPSVVMVHRSLKISYDERMKWRVDIDYYMQLLFSEKTFTYIPERLIHIGINPMQVTNSCLDVPGVELPEGLMLLDKYGTSSLRNILVYDAWWRVIRNTGTRSTELLYRYSSAWPDVIVNMVKVQSHMNPKRLQIGFFSKLFMLSAFLQSIAKRQ